MKMRYKKGDIPVTILVLGVIAIVIVALISFHLTDKKRNQELETFKVLEVLNHVKDNLVLYPNKNLVYVKRELYPSTGFKFFIDIKTQRNYYPIVKDVFEEPGYLVYRKQSRGKLEYELRVPLS
jgi:uncharacterized protein with ParB-like and HNH nuclease domain